MADETEKKDSRDWRNNINFRNKDIDRLLELQKKQQEDNKKDKPPKRTGAQNVNVGLKTLATTTKVPRAEK